MNVADDQIDQLDAATIDTLAAGVAEGALATLRESTEPHTVESVAQALADELREVVNPDVLADALANQAEQYTAAERAERLAEGVDVDGVFDGPYDPMKAMRAITRLNRECEAAEKEYLASKEQTSGFKKSWDSRQHALNKLIGQYDQRSRDTAQSYLQPVDGMSASDPAAAPLCPFERDTHQPCPICRARKPGETVLDEAPANPNHAEHREAARQSSLQALMFALLGRQCFLEIDDLARLDDGVREQLHAWATAKKRGPVYPAVLAQSHVAGEEGSDGQRCTKCGGLLKSRDELEAGVPYVVQSFIGLDCEGREPETARTVAKRGTRNARTKSDPEAERAEQTKAGKAKTAKKAAKGKKAA